MIEGLTMNNEEIDKLITALQEMKTPAPEKIMIPDCSWMIDITGNVLQSESPEYNLEYGYKRTTEEAGKLASKRMIRTNRLSLLAHILGVEREFAPDGENCYVYWSASVKAWDYCFAKRTYAPERVYITKEGAINIVEILNNDEWDLEVDE